MRVFVIGSGAREHALVWKLDQSPRVEKIYVAPGNPGMTPYAERVSINMNQLQELATFAEQQQIDLTIVGPEVPLIDGIVDLFRERGLRIFGPDRAGAALEGSKAFTKELLLSAGIPSARHQTFHSYAEAKAYLEQHGAPIVLKADGNAAGKGAIVALDLETAQDALKQMMVDRIFGVAGDTVVLEDYLQGDEIGATAICNGTHFLPLLLSQDHKRALDHDQGLNTGGMGVFTPLPFVNKTQEAEIYEQVVLATLKALQARDITFTGVLYSNIMLTAQGPMVIEHNTRFGDPETQAFMLLLKEDLLNVLGFVDGEEVDVQNLWYPGSAVSLTLAAGGYPGNYQSGLPITGIEEANKLENVQVFHAGTALKDGQLVTAGGRVLSIAARGDTLQEAVDRVYEAATYIHFEGMHYRKDIAHRGLAVRK
ncbi:phosphoribosylamine--glycine ligase [Tengunoibacter tsumagoiensis]|uniref:Phosphoribosylamine--glycine ligase n=1 Tax=Tengunoibacter tsumagoiensis TaxID=2014871 RepID=A0A401ZVC7_9CHLR|nr:phosphoribosylamine--glycine ligase [Tengunoibacter tsumagoiensis]GCE10752.1 phosphoribosylamine--glycine ligase [Tengunoibacter tsumagoiensis]